jgi:PhnB protein
MVTPYLVFNGNCNEVLDFYQKAFESDIGAPMLYGEYIPDGVKTIPSDLSTWVLHSEMQICGTNFWFADEIGNLEKGNIVRLTLTVPTHTDAQKIFDRLNESAEITLPPTETFYSTFHAALTDKFGINWNIVAEEAPNLI